MSKSQQGSNHLNSVNAYDASSSTVSQFDEQKSEDGVLFWINRSGFPIDDSTWERMWRHATKQNPNGLELENKIRYAQHLQQVAVPTAPLHFPLNTSVPERIVLIQNYMRQLQYNHTGTQLFEIKKNRPITGLMESAKEMIRESLPIKCLEAVILGIYLTNGFPGLERFTISFKTIFSGHVHRHVVLGLHYIGSYGAIGMSRREELMFKPLNFKSLSHLIIDFQQSYKKFWHELKKLKIGMPVSHDSHSYEQICWKYLSLNTGKLSRADIIKDVEKHARDMRSHHRVRDLYGSLGQTKTGHVSARSPRKSVSSPHKECASAFTKKETLVSKSRIAENAQKSKDLKLDEYQIRI